MHLSSNSSFGYDRPEISKPKPCELIFKHFPTELTDKECSDFVVSLGAISTRIPSLRGTRQNYIVAEFPSVDHAWTIIHALHQRSVVDKRISVEFYEPRTQEFNKVPATVDRTTESASSNCLSHPPMAPKWDVSLPVPVHLKYKYPSPTKSILTNIVRCMISCPSFYTQVLHVMNRLHFPPPFCDTELFPGNLVVVTEADFASRMEKTNEHLVSSLQTDKVTDDRMQGVDTVEPEGEEMDLSTSTESELSSEEERGPATNSVPPRVSQPVRRVRARLKPKGAGHEKRRKRSNIDVDESSKLPLPVTESRPGLTITDVFESVPQPCKLELHVPTELPLGKRSTGSKSQTTEGGFGVMLPTATSAPQKTKQSSHESETCYSTKTQLPDLRHNMSDLEFRLRKDSPDRAQMEQITASNLDVEDKESSANSDEDSEPVDSGVSLSLNDLRQGRLTMEERQNYPVFAKGYQSGEPTSRLYIKNLPPRTTPEDLYRIFGAFQCGPVKDLNARLSVRYADTARFSVRLLTEGRMKGQAFISLQCELTALQALEATNGFLLHERPMVVQFARGAKAKVDEKSLIQTT